MSWMWRTFSPGLRRTPVDVRVGPRVLAHRPEELPRRRVGIEPPGRVGVDVQLDLADARAG